MYQERKSWWQKKGFYASTCVALVAVMALGAVFFRQEKENSSEKMLAKIESEVPDKQDSTAVEKQDSLETNARVTPVPAATAAPTEEPVKEEEFAEVSEQKEDEQAEAERKAKVKKAAKKQAAAVSAKLKKTFSAERGLLWPVKGKVLMKYSMDKTVYYKTLAQYRYNPGMLIAADEGTKVKAAADGTVTEVAKDDDYGTVIKMDLGSSYTVTYGQVEGVKVKKGDTVKEGDVIATIAEPTKYFGDEGPHLYLQVNQKKDTVDPLLLLR